MQNESKEKGDSKNEGFVKPEFKSFPKPGFRQDFKQSFRKKKSFSKAGEEFVRVRMPHPDKGEVLGILVENYGSKLLVKCLDGHTRTCRIPGKIRKKIHIKLGDVVLVKKWEVQSSTKGDYLYRYTKTQVNQLIKRGVVKREELE